MNHTAEGLQLLEMKEPVLTARSVNPAALMRAVDVAHALHHHNLRLVGAIHVLRTQCQLPAGGYAASWGEDVVIAVAGIHLRTLYRVVHVLRECGIRHVVRAVVSQHRHPRHAVRLGVQTLDEQGGVDFRP